MGLIIATCNVAGLGNDKKRKSIWQFLRANKFDIIFLQETHLSLNKLKLWEMEWGGKIIWSHSTTNSKGVAIAFKRNLKISLLNILREKVGRYLLAQIVLKQKMLCLADVYSSNNDNPTFFQIFSMILTTFHHMT